MKNEYVEIYARGTGARNHNTSVVKLDDYLLLDHGLFRGLHMIVLDRRNLSKVFNYTYDTMLRDQTFPENIIVKNEEKRCNNYTQKDEILGTEDGSSQNNTVKTGLTSWTTNLTTYLVTAEFEKIKEIKPQLTLLHNGTFIEYTTLRAWNNGTNVTVINIKEAC